MHIMIYNKIVIFKNYITTCLRTKMKGTVITYCEASKKKTHPNATENIIILRIMKKKKKDKRTTKTIALNSSEFPMKTLGCLWPPAALERWQGKGEALKVGRVWSLGEHDPSTGNI